MLMVVLLLVISVICVLFPKKVKGFIHWFKETIHINTHDIVNGSNEQKYLNLITTILDHGRRKMNRTGTGTISKFGCCATFDLTSGKIPLLTTKRMYWKGIVEELLWFIRGSTNSKELSDKGVHIWDKDGSSETIQRLGFDPFERKEGDLGPVYGFQWRHFGAEYINCKTDYTGKGIDQLRKCIEQIKNNPDSRRIVMTAWNPSQLKQMNLPPCHILCQFYVCDGRLSCSMYQRSADIGLGVPFNIASYSLLTHLIANECDMEPDTFVYFIGDAHIYMDHVESLVSQLSRPPKEPPTLKICAARGTPVEQITSKDIELVDYQCHPKIKMNLS